MAGSRTISSLAGAGGKNVRVPRHKPADRPMDAYWVVPDGPGPFPGVVVIHEIFGLTGSIQDVARRFAAEGYAALAIDLFTGRSRPVCLMRVVYGMLVRPLKNGTVKDLEAALAYLRAQPEVDRSRVGAIGFCMGGGYALQLACLDGAMRAASVFYGTNPRPLDAVARACPIVGSYPGRDFTARAARKLEAKLDQFNVPHDIKIYPDTRHSFFNAQGPAYAPEAAADAWKRTLAFFDQQFRT